MCESLSCTGICPDLCVNGVYESVKWGNFCQQQSHKLRYVSINIKQVIEKLSDSSIINVFLHKGKIVIKQIDNNLSGVKLGTKLMSCAPGSYDI